MRIWCRDIAGIGCTAILAACAGGGSSSERAAAGGSGAPGQTGTGGAVATAVGGAWAHQPSAASSSALATGGLTGLGGTLGAGGGAVAQSPSSLQAGAGQDTGGSSAPLSGSGGEPAGARPPAAGTEGGVVPSSAASGRAGSLPADVTTPVAGSSVSGAGGMNAEGTGGNDGDEAGGSTAMGAAGEGAGGVPGAPGGTAGGAMPDVMAVFDAYWSFDTHGDGTVPDLLGGDLPLELDGATLDQGLRGDSLWAAGTDSSASTTSPALNTSESYSVSAWVRLDVLEDFATMVAQDGEQVSAFYLQKRSDGRLSFTTFPEDSTSSTACVVTGQIAPRVGEWYHVVGTRDASSREQRLYVDGLLSGRATCPGGVFAAQGGLSVGRAKYGGAYTDWMTGGVDEVGVSGTVLTPEQVFEVFRAGRPGGQNYLFAYFVEVGEGRGDGLRLAHSHDGLHWGAIGAGKVFMPPSVGGGSFRDPHVMLDPSGLYHLVWTTSCVPWAESACVQDRGFGHASSRNLVDWTEADYVEIALDVEHVWAPETVYDEDSGQYLVFWSSPLDADLSAADPHSIYYLLTPDFKTHSAPEVLYSQAGRNLIDATIRRYGDEYLMIIKDEAEGQKNLRAVTSPHLHGPGAWQGAPSAPLTGNYAAEGPSLLERDGEITLYFDKYADGAYGALRATTAELLEQAGSWEDISESVFFPGVRHGTPIEVTWEVLREVALHAGE